MFFRHKANLIDKAIKDTYSKRQNKALILIYHRVTDLVSDPQLLAVTPYRFERQIKYLKNNYNVISLQELINYKTKNDTVPNKSVVITFDDGYADNLYQAKPILEKYQVPATIFVTAGMLDGIREFWWDEIEKFILLHPNFKNNLVLSVKGIDYSWKINNTTEAKIMYNEMHSLLMQLNHKERTECLLKLSNWSNCTNYVRNSHRILNKAELRKLSSGSLIEIGAHTMTHCVLSNETVENQEQEIFQSKEFLETILEMKINSFSYPFGNIKHFNNDTVKLVKNAEYNCGIANIQDSVRDDSDLFALPRYLIRDWDVNEFQQKLDFFWENHLLSIDQIIKRKFFSNYLGNNALNKLVKDAKQKQPIKQLEKYELNNILQINTTDCKGGAANVAYNLYNQYKKLGYNSHLLVAHSQRNENGIETIIKDNSFMQKLLWQYQDDNSLQDLLHLSSLKIRENELYKKAEIVHFHNLHSNYFNILSLPQLTSLKNCVWTLHDMQALTGHCAHSFDCPNWQSGCNKCPDLTIYPSLKKDTSNLLLHFKKLAYDNSKLNIVCPSNWLLKKVEKSILNKHPVNVIYNGIDTNIFHPVNQKSVRERLNLPLNKFIFLFSADGGINNTWKGTQYFYEVYDHFKANEKILFVNLGADEYTNEKSNWLNIPYINDKEILSLYYSAADVFLYPSLADNCPLVVLEAMACGLPVVTFKTGGIPELVNHMENGYVADYKNTKDLIYGIEHLISNELIMKKMKNNCVLTVQAKFSIQHMVGSYIKLYNDILTK